LPHLHEVGRALTAELAKDKPILKIDDLKRYHQLLIQATEVMNSRLFVVLSAQQHGWTFARKLQFLESGLFILGIFMNIAVITGGSYLGGGENENYMKIAKEFQKRQDKKEDERELRGLARSKPYSKPRVMVVLIHLM